jgi:hypothetical protein
MTCKNTYCSAYVHMQLTWRLLIRIITTLVLDKKEMDLVNKNEMNGNRKSIFNIHKMFMISHTIRIMHTSSCTFIFITLKAVIIHHQEFFKLSQNQFMILGTEIFCVSLQNNYILIFVWYYRNMYVLYSPNHAARIKDTLNIIYMVT